MKYLIFNDLSYLYHKKNKIILTMLFLPILIALINLESEQSVVEIISLGIGSNLSFENFNIVMLLMYLFETFSFIYLIVDVFMKDMNDSLENIFLRLRPLKYIFIKNVIFMLFTFILKIAQYCFMLVLIYFKKKASYMEIFELFFADLIYIYLIQFVFLFIYIIFILLKKRLDFICLSSIIIGIIIPKNILNLKSYLIILIIVIIAFYIFICKLFANKIKKIMENM